MREMCERNSVLTATIGDFNSNKDHYTIRGHSFDATLNSPYYVNNT